MTTNVGTLAAFGARRFLIVTVPDLAKTPFIRFLGATQSPLIPQIASLFTQSYNQALLQIVGQIAFVILLVTAVSLLVTNVLAALAAQNATPTFTFMQNRAGFDIGESPPWYKSP